MKEYEKLAEDWYAAFDGLKEAYIAGFLKAREMAFELLEEDPRSLARMECLFFWKSAGPSPWEDAMNDPRIVK